MWLLPMRTMLRLYIKDNRPKVHDHEWLKSHGHLVKWESLDRKDTVLFVSHDISLGSLFDRQLALADLNRAGGADG